MVQCLDKRSNFDNVEALKLELFNLACQKDVSQILRIYLTCPSSKGLTESICKGETTLGR